MSNTDKTPTTILNAVNSITASNAPVLFLDTCAILDVIRAPQRKEIQNKVVSAANEIISKTLIDPKQLWIVATVMVKDEFNQNFQEVEYKLMQHIKKVNQDIEDLQWMANCLFPLSEVNSLVFAEMEIPNMLRQIAEKLLNHALIIPEDEENNYIFKRSQKRIVDKKRPSQKGWEQYKDCAIIENYLEVSKQLRNRGFQEKCVFVSSNKKDFCDTGTNIHPDLNTEFKEVGLEYAADIAWANHLIFSTPT